MRKPHVPGNPGIRLEIDMNEGTPLVTLKGYCEKCGQLIHSRTINVESFDESAVPAMGAEDAQAAVKHFQTCKGVPP